LNLYVRYGIVLSSLSLVYFTVILLNVEDKSI
jgi:hypothetical protein